MSTITAAQQNAIRDYVNTHHLPEGLGTVEGACSIAAVNLALTGELTDEVPDCMSEVIGRWIIAVQDRMPDEMRNSPAWKDLLPLAAGTGRDLEAERLAVVMDWMWDALALLQPVADRGRYGEAWARMLSERTPAAAAAARAAARAAADAYGTAAARAAYYADSAADKAAYFAADADAIYAAHAAAVYAADAAYRAANASHAAAADSAAGTRFEHLDPAGLLARLIHLETTP